MVSSTHIPTAPVGKGYGAFRGFPWHPAHPVAGPLRERFPVLPRALPGRFAAVAPPVPSPRRTGRAAGPHEGGPGGRREGRDTTLYVS
ncbi:hypothetical protein GCM10027091_76120 [Streptomyces daliensis]